MAGRFLLDTNIVIALFAQDAGVLERLAEAEEVFLPSVVLGEALLWGARVRQDGSECQSDGRVGRAQFRPGL